jgi:hypothetical protein
VQAVDPEGLLVSRTVVPRGRHFPHIITLPADGKTGQYTIFIRRGRQGQADDLSVPLTTLPEVYLLREWLTGGGRDPHPARYYTRSPGSEFSDITIAGERTKVFGPDRRTLLGFTDKQKKEDVVRVGTEGAWIWSFGAPVWNTSTADKSPAVVSVSPERWFMPTPASREMQPQK